MAYAKHIIQRQIIELEMPDSVDRSAIQNQVSQIYRQQVVPLLDAMLSRKAEASSITIDRLEIDIGTVAVEELEKVLAEKISQGLQEKLALVKGQPKTEEMPLAKPARQQQENRTEAALVIYYLQTGLLPWWAQETTYPYLQKTTATVLLQKETGFKENFARLLQNEEALNRLVYTFSDDLLQKATELFTTTTTAVDHLAQGQPLIELFAERMSRQQLRHYWWESILQNTVASVALSEEKFIEKAARQFVQVVAQKTAWVALQQWLRHTAGTTGIIESVALFKNDLIAQTRHEALPATMDETEVESVNFSEKDLITKTQQEALQPTEDKPQKAVSNTEKIDINTTSKSKSAESKETNVDTEDEFLEETNRVKEPVSKKHSKAEPVQEMPDEVVRKKGQLVLKKEENAAQQPPENPFGEPVEKDTERAVRTQKKTAKPQPVPDIDKLYVQNAGLVLLWPFLHRFFQNAGLADEKMFLNEESREQACLLLQYLVTGSTEEVFEADLLLNKMLCGIPLLQPVNTQWQASEDEKELAQNLLLAVLQNGGAIWANLSVAGLRQAYLARAAILSSRDGAWLLQVERKPYDVITDRLPWTVQVVKLPWMERLIFVEW